MAQLVHAGTGAGTGAVSRRKEYMKGVGFVDVVEKNFFIRTTNRIVDKDFK